MIYIHTTVISMGVNIYYINFAFYWFISKPELNFYFCPKWQTYQTKYWLSLRYDLVFFITIQQHITRHCTKKSFFSLSYIYIYVYNTHNIAPLTQEEEEKNAECQISCFCWSFCSRPLFEEDILNFLSVSLSGCVYCYNIIFI